MDPISLLVTGGLTAASMLMSYFGGQKAAGAAKQQAQLSAQNAGLEMKVDQQRQAAMELDAKRKEMEVFRNAQRARSLALDRSTTQGAQFGSALGGSQGQIAGQSGVNLLGIDQNLAIGRNIFGLNQQIDQNKIGIASLGGDIATGQGQMAFGSALASATPALSNLGIAGVNAGIKGIKSFGT